MLADFFSILLGSTLKPASPPLQGGTPLSELPGVSLPHLYGSARQARGFFTAPRQQLRLAPSLEVGRTDWCVSACPALVERCASMTIPMHLSDGKMRIL